MIRTGFEQMKRTVNAANSVNCATLCLGCAACRSTEIGSRWGSGSRHLCILSRRRSGQSYRKLRPHSVCRRSHRWPRSSFASISHLALKKWMTVAKGRAGMARTSRCALGEAWLSYWTCRPFRHSSRKPITGKLNFWRRVLNRVFIGITFCEEGKQFLILSS